MELISISKGKAKKAKLSRSGDSKIKKAKEVLKNAAKAQLTSKKSGLKEKLKTAQDKLDKALDSQKDVDDDIAKVTKKFDGEIASLQAKIDKEKSKKDDTLERLGVRKQKADTKVSEAQLKVKGLQSQLAELKGGSKNADESADQPQEEDAADTDTEADSKAKE